MLPMSADTATAPRILQYEQVQRRALLNPSVNFTRKRTVPQWHAASISLVSFFCMVKLPIAHTFNFPVYRPPSRLKDLFISAAFHGLLDHLVGAREERIRHREAERFRSVQIDRQLVFHRRLHR